MADRMPGRASDDRSTEKKDRWRRGVLLAQGVYYVLTGLWPIVHFPSFARVVAIHIIPFQAHAFSALIVVIGASLIEAARRGPPGSYPTLLGAAVAGAIALVELIWLPRLAAAGGLWLDFVVEVALVTALLVLYPRTQAEPSRTTSRRR